MTTREKLATTGLNAAYDKSCLDLTGGDVARGVRAGEKHAIMNVTGGVRFLFYPSV